ncbi:MAG: AI-2E family transporter [Methanosarcina sp.]|uniref:AI-2E family transporter n=1 Tax=Methanosarcina sp. TaxID=2213 RepID=UPI003BB624BF
MSRNTISVPASILMYSTFAVILTIGMREIAPILTTIFFSIFTALIFTPIVRWLKRKGVPSGLSVLIVILLFVSISAILGVVVVGAAIQFGNQIPLYQDQLIKFMDSLTRYIPSYEGLSVKSIFRSAVSITVSLMVSIINGIVNAGTTAGIVIVTTAFLLIDVANIPEKNDHGTEKQSELQLKMSRFSKNLLGFIVIRTETNLITATGVTILLLIGGINFAILWGAVIFLLSYVPYVGLVLASIPPTMLALFQYGPIGALAVLVVISLVNLLAEDFIFPSLAGKGLKLSPAILFLTLLYWNYVLGSAGVLLSVPLTMVLKIILESFDETKWIARLIGPTDDKEEYEVSGDQGEENVNSGG